MWWKQNKQEVSDEIYGRRVRTLLLTILSLVLLVLIWKGRGHFSSVPIPKTLVVYGFSIMEEAIEDGIFPAFQRHWRDETGEQVELVATFAGSGTITGEIIERFPAEIAILSSKMDVLRLAESGILSQPAWKDMPHGGNLTRSPVVILVRQGNPLGIVDFADLAAPGVKVLHPDPTT